MKNSLLIGLIFISICFSFCKNSNPKEKAAEKDSFASAMPHSEMHSDTELSEEDKEKLINAKGKSAISISINEIDSLLKYSEGILHIYSFFKLDHEISIKTNQMLLNIQQTIPESSVKLILFNLDPPSKLNQLNTYIRSNNVTSEVFYTSDLMNSKWWTKFQPNWDGKLPAILLLNKTDGTQLFYQRQFNKEEFLTVLQPFIL